MFRNANLQMCKLDKIPVFGRNNSYFPRLPRKMEHLQDVRSARPESEPWVPLLPKASPPNQELQFPRTEKRTANIRFQVLPNTTWNKLHVPKRQPHPEPQEIAHTVNLPPLIGSSRAHVKPFCHCAYTCKHNRIRSPEDCLLPAAALKAR